MVQTVPQNLTESRRDADRFPVSGAETKNEWPYISTPQSAFMECTGTTLGTAFQFSRVLMYFLVPVYGGLTTFSCNS